MKIKDLGPSAFVRSCASEIVAAAETKQILDVACGAGRNAIYLSQLGCKVVCMDRDLGRLLQNQRTWESHESKKKSLDLIPFQIDLLRDRWPFEAQTVGGIVNVHFFAPGLFPCFAKSLIPGGYLLLETPPGHGRNYKELPLAGATKFAFEDAFDIEIYKESRVGPPGSGAVTVKMLAKRVAKWRKRHF